MRKLGVFIIDLLFATAWLGLITALLWIVNSFLYGLTGGSIQRELLSGYGKQIFWSTVVLWIGLSASMFISCYGNSRFDDFQSNLWTRILVIQFFFVVGPTAYYIGSLRGRILGRTGGRIQLYLKKSRSFLDILYFLSFWGSIGFLASMVTIVLFANSVESIRVLGTIAVVLLPLGAIATIVLNVIFLIDAVERPKEQWEQLNFLKLLNPWSWIFGIRKYYLQVLRPELVTGRVRKA